MKNFGKTRFLAALVLPLSLSGLSCSIKVEALSSDAVEGLGSAMNLSEPGAGIENRVPGEYLVTVVEDGDESRLRETFGAYAIRSVEKLGRGRFLIVLGEDPGPAEIERIGGTSALIERVQPNYIYGIESPMVSPPPIRRKD